MYLLLIRHGETDWNNQGRVQGQTDIPLNPTGIQQAQQLAAHLATQDRIDILYTSPLQRARVTAEIIGNRLGLAPISDARLVERSVGKIEGLTLLEIKEAFPDIFQAWRDERWQLLLPGAEDQPSLFQRVVSFLETLKDQHVGKRIGVVSHGGTLGMVLATILEMDIHKRFPFRFDNTSLSRIDFARGRPRIELLNDTCHLHLPEYERAPSVHEQAANALETE